MKRLAVRDPSTALGLYVHIPFCAARCPYCDFATAPARSALRSRYLDALDTEIRREGERLGRPRVATVFFGGGTPSLLEPAEVARLGAALREAFDLRPDEATVEANPATLDRARLEAWAALGITRLSLGAQSLSADGLRALGRTHQPHDIPPALAAARSVGFDVNLDLIFGWPGQTPEAWRADLEAAVALGPDHLSCYPLELALEPEEAVANWPGAGWRSGRRRHRHAVRARGGVPGTERLPPLRDRELGPPPQALPAQPRLLAQRRLAGRGRGRAFAPGGRAFAQPRSAAGVHRGGGSRGSAHRRRSG
jgi:hypothetical protein